MHGSMNIKFIMLVCGDDKQNGRSYYSSLTSTEYTPQWTMLSWNNICEAVKIAWKKKLLPRKKGSWVQKGFGPYKTRHTDNARTYPKLPGTVRNCVCFLRFEWKIWELVLHWIPPPPQKKEKSKREMKGTSKRLQPNVDIIDYVNSNWRARN
jgi:hypothetical protein